MSMAGIDVRMCHSIRRSTTVRNKDCLGYVLPDPKHMVEARYARSRIPYLSANT